MKIFIIPSWYPTSDHPITGIFIKEQIRLYADQFPEDKIGVSLWGSHIDDLLIDVKGGLRNIPKLLSRFDPKVDQLTYNLTSFFNPSFTWSRLFKQGNINGIIKANEVNFKEFANLHGKPELIHAHIAYPGGFVARHLAKQYEIPYIITENMSPFPLDGLKYGFEKYVLTSLKEANDVISVSEELKDRLDYFNIDSKVLSNFIDDQFFYVNTERAFNAKTINFLNVGRLETQKGHQTLIDACNHLKGKLDLKLTIVGEGSLRRELEAKVQNLGLEELIQFHGEGNPNQILEAIHQCDVFVFPSLHESFGIAPLEALACGKPIIGTSVGAVGEMINEDTGRLVAIDNPSELAGAMQELARNLKAFDVQKIRHFYDENFSRKKVLEKLRMIYEQTISSA